MCSMWARLHGSASTHKRMLLRDNSANSPDIEENLAMLQNGMGQESRNPSLKRSFPHVLVATLASFLCGYHLGVVNEPLESISTDLGFHGDTMVEGLVVSICLGGALVGCLLSGWIADGVGRRRAFQLCALPMILGGAISASTDTVMGMLLGRFTVGIGLGLGPAVASLYITEVSPSFVRGTYGSFIQIATCFGLMGALFIGIPVKDIAGWWRICFWVSIIPAVILAVGMEFSAESPHWLYKQGRIAEAESQFERLLGGMHGKSAMAEFSKSDRGDDADVVSFSELIYGRHFRGTHADLNFKPFSVVVAMLTLLQQQLLPISFPFFLFKVYCFSPFPFAVVFIGSTLFALQQLSGINAVFYFSSTVFRSAGIPSNLANAFIGVANLVGSVIALILMDKLGRKILLLWSFSGMVLSTGLQVAAAGVFASSSGAQYLSVIGMLMFVFSFAVGVGPVPGLLLPEIFPNRIRAKAVAFCMSVHWVFNFLVGLLFLRLLEKMGPQLLYTMFGTFCLMGVIFVKRNVMETKGKSLQEIEIALLPQD